MFAAFDVIRYWNCKTSIFLVYCYENGNGVLKMINNSTKNQNEWVCLYDQYSTNFSLKKGDKEVNKQQQHQYKKEKLRNK